MDLYNDRAGADGDLNDEERPALVRLLQIYPFLDMFMAREKPLRDHALNCQVFTHCYNFFNGNLTLKQVSAELSQILAQVGEDKAEVFVDPGPRARRGLTETFRGVRSGVRKSFKFTGASLAKPF